MRSQDGIDVRLFLEKYFFKTEMVSRGSTSTSAIESACAKLFDALDLDHDGYLTASDMNVLGKVLTGRFFPQHVAEEQLQRAKQVASTKIRSKAYSQPDALSLEEFIANSEVLLLLKDEQDIVSKLEGYTAAAKRITGLIPEYELALLKVARDSIRRAASSVPVSASEGNFQVDIMKYKSVRSLFAEQ